MMIITIVKYSEYIYVILVTQIKGIPIIFFKSDLLFPELWLFQIFYESVNFRVNDLFKNPHCTKYIGHRTISNMFYERKLYKDSKTVIKFEIKALFIGLPF